MPVTPCCTNLFQDRKDLYQFLLACRQVAIEKASPQIVSISITIPSVDPLAILSALKQPDQPHFYFEKRDRPGVFSNTLGGVAIAAIDAVLSFKVEGRDRFSQVKTFIQSSLENLITVGDLASSGAGPHFFCGFTFFDTNPAQHSPFPGASIFLPRWQVSRCATGCTVVANLLIHSELNLQAASERLWHQFHLISSIRYDVFPIGIDHRQLSRLKSVQGTESFKSAVASALRSIEANHLRKIVLAHALDVVFPVPLHLIHSLHHLRQVHPDCYVFSIDNGQGQTFIGASPERLVKIQNHRLSTDALAGSAPRGTTTAEDVTLAKALLSSPKELHEHRLVADFITQRLTRLGLQPHLFSRRLLQLSNIQHLQTPVQADVPSDVHLLDILAELHPTPAVAGMPRSLACEQIRQYEGFERSLYAAPLGWVDHEGNGEFIVGIRSALVNGCHARLYAGAGIVAGSEPERELAEVQLKLKALLGTLV